MTDHPSKHTEDAGQGDSSPQNDREPIEIAPETTPGEDNGNKKGGKSNGKEDNGDQQDLEEMQKGEEEVEEGEEAEEGSAPPLPNEVPPPLPNEAPPGEDDGWEPVWDANVQSYYFYNRLTGVSQWENPRVPVGSASENPSSGDGDGDGDEPLQQRKAPVAGGYNPLIHGDYDPTAPYAQQYEQQDSNQAGIAGGGVAGFPYEATGTFNRFTGKWQAASLQPENYNDENKSRRQMNAFFDVDAAANSHDGRSLRAERSAKKLSKKELKAFKDKRREKKEEKRRAWLRD